MNRQESTPLRLQTLCEEFEVLTTALGQAEQAQCIRLLGMYLALYKSRFGDLPSRDYAEILNSAAIDGQLGSLVENGLCEANGMLRLVMSKTGSDNLQIDFADNDYIN